MGRLSPQTIEKKHKKKFEQNKGRTTAFNPSKVTGNMVEYKQCSYSFRKTIKQAQCLSLYYDGLPRENHITDTEVLLPDKLNTVTL
jgi:hypothetical protein